MRIPHAAFKCRLCQRVQPTPRQWVALSAGGMVALYLLSRYLGL